MQLGRQSSDPSLSDPGSLSYIPGKARKMPLFLPAFPGGYMPFPQRKRLPAAFSQGSSSTEKQKGTLALITRFLSMPLKLGPHSSA